MTSIDCRDLEAEISKFEQVCADLANIKLDLECKPKIKPKPGILKKQRPAVPPKPKMVSMVKTYMTQEESPEGTEV